MLHKSEKLIFLDIDGCIMPPNRGIVELKKLQQLQETIKNIKRNVKITIFTGRSQGYVEFLAQVLHIEALDYELPFVIENGTAFYFPRKKTIENLLPKTKFDMLHEAKTLIRNAYYNNPFELKENIITINPLQNQTIKNLKQSIQNFLSNHNMIDKLKVTNSASSVDIVPAKYNKLYGVKRLIRAYCDTNVELVAIGDSDTDFEVLSFVDRAYVPQNASLSLKRKLKNHRNCTFLSYEHIEATLLMLRLEM